MSGWWMPDRTFRRGPSRARTDNKNNGGATSMPARILCLTVLLVLTPLARADGLVGLGFVNNVIGANLEWTFEHSTVYLVPGYYFDSGGARTDTLRWVTGYRHILEDGTTDETGFYTGVMGGHVDGKRQTERLGLGGELGHQWVTDNTRWTLSAGLVALEERELHDESVEPEAFFAFSVSLR